MIARRTPTLPWRPLKPAVWVSRRRQSDIARIFDLQKYFANFNHSPYLASSVGLFQNKSLTSPDGLELFSKRSLAHAKSLVREMVVDARNTEMGKLAFIRKLDQLSDILCRVIDVAEFIRVCHPSQKWVEAAQNTHEIMFEFMNQLNTNVELYRILAQVLDSYSGELSAEEVEVGRYLLQDFERSGIAMDPQTRANFVAITQEISLLGSAFGNDTHALDLFWCPITELELRSIEPELRAQILDVQKKAPGRKLAIPLAGNVPYTILTTCASEEVRRKVWVAMHNSPKNQIKTLDSFVRYRALLASMLGYESYAHYQLEHKMAKLPQNVIAFLRNLQESLMKGVVEEIKDLESYRPATSHSAFSVDAPEDEGPLKKALEASGQFEASLSLSDTALLAKVKPWDRDYLVHQKSLRHSESPVDISEYLSVGTVMSGLDQLFRSIYNVSLVPEKTLKGETWDHHQVRKIAYVDLATGDVMGYLYADLWSKMLPSHFTIVCSRELNTDLGETRSEMSQQAHLSGDYQLPVIALVCNFQKPSGWGDTPTLLTLEQVDTIFHEMGHAMHSMLGRTRLHNLSGTRCQTDFVELPSVLMELFSSDPRVLCRIARHYQTGEALPEELLKQYQAHRDSLRLCETFMQSKMALLDQVLHDEKIVDFTNDNAFKAFSSTVVYHALEKQLKVFTDEYSTWHGKFPHLFSYGAVYYSYLLDRAIAEKIWNGLFKEDPWSSEAGAKYANSVLKWGGTRDPWVCLADALDDPELAKGDAQAMKKIGHL